MRSGGRSASRCSCRSPGWRSRRPRLRASSARLRRLRLSRRAKSRRPRRRPRSPSASTKRGCRRSRSAMPEPGPVAFYARGLARNIAAGARLAFFLPLRRHDFRASAVDYAVLLAFNFALWVLAAAVRADFAGDFDTTAILVYLASVALVLFAALLIAQAYGAPQALLLFAVALTSADPVFELIGLALPGIGAALGQAQVAYVGYLAWTWLASVRAVALCGGRRRPALYQGALAVSAMIAAGFFLLPRTDVWIAPEAEEALGETVADERLFHLQGQLIERALAAIEPGRPGAPELFF